MTVTALMPRQAVPALDLPLVGGGRYIQGVNPGDRFDLLVFYRGLHCPLCASYLRELEKLAGDFAARGVNILAISSDVESRAAQMADKIKAKQLRFAYDLPLASARAWGLYISTSRGVTSIGLEEPALFSEPGVFIVRPDGTLYYGAVQTMPFARPSFTDLLMAIDFSMKHDYPARGEYQGEV